MSLQRARRRLLLPLQVCALAACAAATTPTETIVLVNAEPGVRAATAQLHLVVTGRGPGGGSFEQTVAPKWPTTLALVPAHGDASRVYSVVAEALGSNQDVVASARLVSGYVRDQKRFVVLMLEDACLGVVCTDPESSCHAGTCESAHLAPLDFGSTRQTAPTTSQLLQPGSSNVQPGLDGATPDATLQQARDGGSIQSKTDGGTADGGSRATKDAGSVHGDAGVLEDAGTQSSDAGATRTKDIGESCGGNDECGSHLCVDHFCCKTACEDACSACGVTGNEGTCSPIPDSQPPATGHPSCGPDPQSSCMRDGSCDGKGMCRRWPLQTQCKPPSCDPATNEFSAESTCDGMGACVSPASITCTPWACMPDQTACYTSCTAGGSECSSGNVCTNGSCGRKVTSSSCSADAECQSNHCADSVCCGDACGGLCQACDLSASRGSCTTITSGQPHATHGSCAGVGAVCGGQCGGDPSACSYPGSGTPCRTQSCASGTLTLAAGCDSAGACAPVSNSSCTPPSNASATCSGNACGFSCNAGYILSGGQCVPCGRAGQPCCGGPFAACVPGTACGGGTCSVNDLYVFGWAFDTSFNLSSVAMHYDGSTWGALQPVFPTGSIHVSVGWGFAPGSYYAIGDSGNLAELSGSTWTVCATTSFCTPTNATDTLGALYGFSAVDMWTAGGSSMLHYDGSSWSSKASGLPSSHAAEGLWGTSSTDLWFTGGYHYNGTTWSQSTSINGAQAFWGAASNDVWAVGSAINHWNGSSWSPAYGIGGSSLSGTLYSISGSATDDVWAVGFDGSGNSIVVHWDGTQWTSHSVGAVNTDSVWVASKKQAWMTANGPVYSWDGLQWSQVTLPALPSGTQAVTWVSVYGSANGR